MRFQGFVQEVLAYYVKSNFDRIHLICGPNGVKGGCEVWLQVEIFLLLENYQAINWFTRELAYPRPYDNLRADFFSPKTASEIQIWVELKTQRKAEDVRQPINGFIVDYEKIENIHLDSNNSVGAAVIIPANTNPAIIEAKENISSRFQENIFLYSINKNSISPAFRLLDFDPKEHEIPKGDILIMYHVSK